MIIEASACGKIILFGEHAVVYGQPAMAVPLPTLRTKVTINKNHTRNTLKIRAYDIQRTYTIDSPVKLTSADPGPVSMVKQVLLTLQIPTIPAIDIGIHSQIPIASGLGSGASVSTAIGRALMKLFGFHLDQAILNELVFKVEQLYHGSPSGVDNTVIVYEQPVFFVRGIETVRFSISHPFHLLIADTGVAAPTREVVADVRSLVEKDTMAAQITLTRIGEIVRNAREVIANNNFDRLGQLMDMNHELLQQLTVSSPELDRLVETARNSGAMGAKLSGGGRGGNIIALVKEEKADLVANTLLKNGAIKVYRTTVQ